MSKEEEKRAERKTKKGPGGLFLRKCFSNG